MRMGANYGERGILPGLVILALCFILMIRLGFKTWSWVGKGDFLPWLILSMAFLAVVNGQWAQPSL